VKYEPNGAVLKFHTEKALPSSKEYGILEKTISRKAIEKTGRALLTQLQQLLRKTPVDHDGQYWIKLTMEFNDSTPDDYTPPGFNTPRLVGSPSSSSKSSSFYV
jgi:hypothetical protein